MARHKGGTLGQERETHKHTGIPQSQIKSIARIFLPDIQAYYETEEGQREFAEWKIKQDNKDIA